MSTEKFIPYVCLPRLAFERRETRLMGPVQVLFEEGHTTLSFSSEVPEEKYDSLLLDSCLALYFITACRDLYLSAEPPPIDAFHDFHQGEARKLGKELQMKIPSEEWMGAMGHLLLKKYVQGGDEESERLLLAIRFFLAPLFPQLRNLSDPRWHPNTRLLESEHFTLLATSMVILFALPLKNPGSIFKQKIRQNLDLRYSRSVETLWMWVDGFLSIREMALTGMRIADPYFRANPCFEITYEQFGIKLFIFTFFHYLEKMNLIKEMSFNANEIKMLLWPEDQLLHKLSILLMQPSSPQIDSDIEFLIDVYRHMKPKLDHPSEDKERIIEAILQYSARLPEDFLQFLTSK